MANNQENGKDIVKKERMKKWKRGVEKQGGKNPV